jgi:UDP-glucose 4-epimerase
MTINDNRRVMVIGGAGFLGRQLCKTLAGQGKDVLCVARQRPAGWSGEVAPPEDLSQLPDDFAAIYLVAAVIPYGRLNEFSAAMTQANIALPLMVAERFAQARLVYASSVSVYGQPLSLPIDEGHPFNNPSAYALTKLAGETVVRAHENHAVLRLPSLYGPDMTATTFLPIIIGHARQTGKITLLGDGSRRQDYLHVRDAAAMLAAAGSAAPIGVFNAVSGQAVSNLEVAQTIARIAGHVEIAFSGQDVSPSCIYAAEAWRNAFNFEPAITLHEGLREMMGHG